MLNDGAALAARPFDLGLDDNRPPDCGNEAHQRTGADKSAIAPRHTLVGVPHIVCPRRRGHDDEATLPPSLYEARVMVGAIREAGQSNG